MKFRIGYPLRLTLIYLLIGGLWIIFTDRLAAMLFTDPHTLLMVNTYKGWFYVAVTAILLYLALRSEENIRKKDEQALRASEDKFKYLFEHSVIGKSFTLPSGEVDVNPTFCNMLGYSQEELKLRKWQELTHPDDINLTQKEMNILLSGENDTARFTKRFLHRNGSIVWVDISTTLRRDEASEPLYFVTDMLDITAQKQSEEAMQALSTRQEAILAAIPDILMEVNKDKIYVWANRAGLEFFGEDVIGKEAANYFVGEQETYKLVDPLFDGKEVVTYVESWQRRKDGEKRLLAWHCRALMDNEGRVTGALSSAHDITESKQAADALKNYNDRLAADVAERTRELMEAQEKLVRQEKLAVLGQLSGGVGHELRNPLGVINNAVYYLKLIQPEADLKIQKYHRMIQQEVHNAEKIIGDLLDFARVETAEREQVAVAELVDQTVERFPIPAGMDFKLEFPADLPMVYADPHQMVQVLGNLILNACQAMKELGKLTICGETATLGDGQAGVRIQVKDTGPGISAENMKKLFEPLFTTKPRGIGLGLVVSRKLVEANGGRIEVESEAGKGATFTVYLPVKS